MQCECVFLIFYLIYSSWGDWSPSTTARETRECLTVDLKRMPKLGILGLKIPFFGQKHTKTGQKQLKTAKNS